MLALKKVSILFMLGLLLSACVTINVYFPAAAAEKAADQIIEKVLRSEEQPKTPEEQPKPSEEQPNTSKSNIRTFQRTTDAVEEFDDIWDLEQQSPMDEPESSDETSEPQSLMDEPGSTKFSSNEFVAPVLSLSHWLANGFDFLISPVYAAEINFNISSPIIQALQEQMAERHKRLKKGYQNGAIGYTHNGLIALRDPKKVPLRSFQKVERWIEEENQDRLDLYTQIAVANGHPEWEIQIRQTFAEQWIEHAEPGWWYQDKEQQWQRKPIEE